MSSTRPVGRLASEDTPQLLPPRSRLYPLEPVGLGTGGVESATSYVARLAIAHTVSTWSLLKCEIAPLLYGPDFVFRNRLSELVSAMGSAFNGENTTCRKVASILNSLTLRTDLLSLSMAFSRGFVSPRLLMRREQAWCPECLSKSKSEGGPTYWPLLWNLAAVRSCPKHRASLLTVCPGCQRSFYPLTAHSRPGHCARCGRWLGGENTRGAEARQALAADHETAAQVYGFLASGPAALAVARSSVFSQNIETLKKVLFGGKAQALARCAGVNRFTVVAWASAQQLPSLLSLADLSLKVGICPEALVSRCVQAEEFMVTMPPRGRAARRLHKPPPRHDLERMRLILEGATQDDVFPRRSLSSLAAQLGCSQTTLARRFPDLARKIKDLYTNFSAIRKEVRSRLVRGMVRMSTCDLHKAGH